MGRGDTLSPLTTPPLPHDLAPKPRAQDKSQSRGPDLLHGEGSGVVGGDPPASERLTAQSRGGLGRPVGAEAGVGVGGVRRPG